MPVRFCLPALFIIAGVAQWLVLQSSKLEMPVRFWSPALINADVAQLVRASLCQGEDRRFESDYPLKIYLIVTLRVASFNGQNRNFSDFLCGFESHCLILLIIFFKYIIAAITQWQSGALIRLKSVVRINLAAQKLKCPHSSIGRTWIF